MPHGAADILMTSQQSFVLPAGSIIIRSRWGSRYVPQQADILSCTVGSRSSAAWRSPGGISWLRDRVEHGGFVPHLSCSIKAKVATVAEPVDIRSFPFSERGFSSLKLSRQLLQRLEEFDLRVPTDIQAAAIPLVLAGHDAAIHSYTGSGKTLAFLLPILSRIGPLSEEGQEKVDEAVKKGRRGVEAVIVAPSRELAMQIVREAERLLGPSNRKFVQQLIGGANMKLQEEALKKNKPMIVVGTPGRISDISRAGRLHTHGCRFLVLDEADQLLSPKYRDSMHRILEHVGQRRFPDAVLGAEQRLLRPSSPELVAVPDGGPDSSANAGEGLSSPTVVPGSEGSRVRNRVERQTLLVSATMPPGVLRAASKWGHKPLLVRATSVIEVEMPGAAALNEDLPRGPAALQESLPPNLDHKYIIAPLQHKVDTARKCIHALDARSILVFMNHGRSVKDVVFKLEARGIASGGLHGDLSKMERGNLLASFRNGKIRVLVCSEVAARGLDVPNCDLVINLELPTDGLHYAHRGGRTGRLGRNGTVISICEGPEEFVLRKFENQLGISILRYEAKGGQLVPL